MASTNMRQLGVASLQLGLITVAGVGTLDAYPDTVGITINSGGSLVASTTEGDVWANHFMQMMEKTDTLSVETKSGACAQFCEDNIGKNFGISFVIPPAANSTGSPMDYTVTSTPADGGQAGMLVCSSVNISGNTGQESTFSIEFTVTPAIASDNVMSSGLTITATAAA